MNELERYAALANLKKLDPSKGEDHAEEMWHIIRSLACLDFALANSPEDQDRERNIERYATIVRKVQQLALQIQEEQGMVETQIH